MIRIWIAAAALLFSTNVLALDDGSYTNYESIVNELKASIDDTDVAPPHEDLDWQAVALHANLGFATSYVSPAAPNGAAGSGLLKGVQVGFGMNLFTRLARVEGAFSSYATEELSSYLKADLKEFELRLVYLPPLEDKTVLRFGLGLAARYMNVDTRDGKGQWTNEQASTPSTVALVGFERKITSNLSVGPDVSWRSALVSDTFDKSAWDASFRLNASF